MLDVAPGRPGDLLALVSAEVMTAINRAGLDLNRCLRDQSFQHALQFICGLGPRKVDELVTSLRDKEENGGKFRSREHLKSYVGDEVWYNCCGFLKIIGILLS